MKLLIRIIASFLLTTLCIQNTFGQNITVTALPLPTNTLAQIQALQQEKAARSPAQRKMSSHLVQAFKHAKGQPMAPGVTHLFIEPLVDAENMVLVDLRATVTPRLLEAIRQAGGQVISSFTEQKMIRARLPIGVLEDIASDADVQIMRAADLGYANAGSVTSEADATHRAGSSRTNYGVNGSGIKIGVLSDSVKFLSTSIASSDLDNSLVVVAGQDGVGTGAPDIGEGTAMLELVHDIAPGAQLYFATAKGGMPQMAANIRALRSLGCQIIIDDFTYAVESPFQDGVIDSAVKDVSDSGVLYFSSAANSGNLDSGTSSTWEGDFNPGVYINGTGTFHDWGGGIYTNQVLRGGTNTVMLFWAEPISIASSDYDVFTYDPAGNVVSSGNSTTADGFETALARPNDRIAVVLANGTPEFIHAEVIRGGLRFSTSGSTRGHNAPTAANAFGVAATDVRGPFPDAFNSANVVENFSSDGPRRKFFYADATPMTPGNFSSSGGIVYQKPDLTAADGAATSGAFTTNSGLQPFFGTSAAAPHAGAIAALLLSYKPGLTPAQVRAALLNTAIDIQGAGWDRDSGWGIIMADRALAFVSDPPDVHITAPVAGPGYNSVHIITGTAADHSKSGLLRIDLKIAQGSDYWNGSSWSPVQTVLHPTVGTTWSYGSVPTGANLRSGSYVVTAAAVDNVSHTSSVVSVTFQVDAQPPTIAFAPLTNQQVVFNFAQLGGTISEAGTVKFKIEWFLPGGNQFWSGTSWSTDDSDVNTLFPANVAGLNWAPANGTLPSRAQIFQGTYLIHAIVTDLAGNTNNSTLVLSRSAPDTTPPIVTLDNIHNGDAFTNPVLPGLSGLTLDYESGIASVSVYLNRFSNGDILYWNGSSWSSSHAALAATYNPQTVVWQVTNPLPSEANLPNAAYQVQVSVQNQEAPAVTALLSVNFLVDYHPTYVFTAGSYADANPFNDNMRWDNSANWDVGNVPTSDARVVISNYSPDNTSLGSLQLHRLDLSGGTLTTDGMVITNLNFSGGTLSSGPISLPAKGVFNWSGGILGGVITVPFGAKINISGAGDKTLAVNSTVNQAGNVIWTGAGNLNAAYGCTWNNTGTFSIQGDAQFYNYTGGAPAPTFNNNGVIQKTNAAGVTVISAANGGWVFNNNGVLDITSGVLSLQNLFYLNNGGIISGSGILRINGNTTILSGTNTLQSGGTFELAGGTVTGTNTFNGTGAFNWTSGAISAAVDLQSNITLNISGVSEKYLTPNSTLNLVGNATWTGAGNVNLSYSSAMTNRGNFVVQNDAQFYNYTSGAPQPLFVNIGTFTKTNSPGTTAINAANGGMAFNNTGSVRVQTGSLTLGGGGMSQNASFNIAPGAEMDLTGGAHNFGSGLNFSGGLTRMLAGTLYLSGTNGLTNSAAFEITGGTVTGTNTFIGAGAFNWTGGTISAELTLQSNVAFNISGASSKTLALGTITTAGNALWTGAGDIYISYNSALNNSGNFVVQNDAQFYNYTGGLPQPLFDNTGTFTKTNSPGTTVFNTASGGMAFNNTGSVNVQSGNLSLGGGGTSANDSFTVVAGSVIDFTAGSFFFTGNQALLGGGTNRVIGATVTFNNGTNTLGGANTFEIASGSIYGTNTFAGAGTINWTAGTIAAALNLQPGIALNISGVNIKTFAPGGGLTVAGSTLWTGGDINVSYSSAFINNGTFNAQSGGQLFNYTGGAPGPAFVNNGAFIKSTAAAATIFRDNNGGMAFNNNGTINLQTGDLTLGGGGGGANGIFTTASGSHIDLQNGSFNWSGNSTISGAGVTRVSNGTLTFSGGTTTLTGTFEVASGSALGTNTFAGPGTFNWTSGNIGANFTLQPNIAFNISVAGDKTLLQNGTINNAGTTTWSGSGNLNMGYGSSINNSGTFTVLNDMPFFNYTGGAPGPAFNNTGTFRKATATGQTTFHPSNGGVSFNNTGTVDLGSGTIVIMAGYATSPSSRLQIPIGGLTANTQFGTEQFYTPAIFDGTLVITLTNGFTPTNGQSFVLATYGSASGQFATTQFPPLPATSKWLLTYNPTSLVLQVVPSTAFQTFSLADGGFQFSLVGPTGSKCLIEATTNLFDWSPLLTNVPFTGTLNFTDLQTSQFPKRFFRAKIDP